MTEYALDNGALAVRFLDRGGIITAIEAPDRNGRRANVVVALPDATAYATRNGTYYLGALIGRYAGRIAGARFAIDGHVHQLAANDGANALHGGGRGGFDTEIWSVEPIDAAGAVLRLISSAGAGGFPGRLEVSVTYRLQGAALRIDYAARTDAPTVINLTNHSYFNLAGGGSVLGHHLEIAADRIAELDAAAIPTGRFVPVSGTAFDFRASRPIGAGRGGFPGYDHSWILGNDGMLAPAARLADPLSGRTLDLLTTEPTLHAYTADHFDGADQGAEGAPLIAHRGIALEAQHLPDSPNRPDFPSTLLRPGETFRSTTIFAFGVAASPRA